MNIRNKVLFGLGALVLGSVAIVSGSRLLKETVDPCTAYSIVSEKCEEYQYSGNGNQYSCFEAERLHKKCEQYKLK